MSPTGALATGTSTGAGDAAGLRLAVAEDSVLLRDGLIALLTRRGFDVVASAGDGESLLAAIDALPPERRPRVAVLDVRMPPSFTDEGLRTALRLRADHPEVGILLFSQYVESRFAARLFGGDARGMGYLLKDRVAEVGDFVDAIVQVASGQTVLDPEVVTQLFGAAATDAGLARLSPREREVLEHMAQGRSNGAIAERLVLSYGAVEKHVSAIFTKLDLAPDAGDHRRVLAVLRYLAPGA